MEGGLLFQRPFRRGLFEGVVLIRGGLFGGFTLRYITVISAWRRVLTRFLCSESVGCLTHTEKNYIKYSCISRRYSSMHNKQIQTQIRAQHRKLRYSCHANLHSIYVELHVCIVKQLNNAKIANGATPMNDLPISLQCTLVVDAF